MKDTQERKGCAGSGPGPAAYKLKSTLGQFDHDPTITMNPAYSLRPLIHQKIKTVGPGPIYDVTWMNQHGKQRTIGGFMGRRFPEPNTLRNKMPAPSDYWPKVPTTNTAPKMKKPLSLKSRRPRTEMAALYILPDTLSKRTTKFGKRFDDPKRASCGPGPASYILPHGDFYLHGRHAAGALMAGRLNDLSTYQGPGPAHYCVKPSNLCPCKPSADVCRTTFGRKRPDCVLPYIVPADNEFDSDCCI